MDEQSGNVVARFFRFIFRAIRNYFILVGALVTIGWLMVIVVIVKAEHRATASLSPKPHLNLSKDHPAPLKLDLSGKIAEKEPDFTETMLARFFRQDRDLYLPELRSGLRRAAKDDRVAKLIVHFGPLSASPADYTELRRLLADFRAGGKRLEADLPVADDWSYYVATAADSITLNPASEVMIPGPAFHLMYFADALKKLGVDIDVVRAGKFKSAFEPFVLNAPSEAALEEYSTMQQSLMDHILTLVAEGRKKDKEVVRGWYKRSIFTTDEALKQGLIDAVGYPAESDEEQGEDEGDTAAGSAIKLSEYADATSDDKEAAESVKDAGGIALIEAVGEINMAPSGGTRPSEEGITPPDMRRQLRWAKQEDKVKAVVLRVSSPGGSALASDLIWHEVKELAAKKPLIVSMGAYAASGGYYISAPAKVIVAEPTTITGSIGVIGMLPSVKPFQEKYGVSFYVISTSDRRELLNLGSKATPEDKALVEATIDQVYKAFLQRVSEGRKMPVAEVEKLAQGRVYSGVQGKALGLVDQLGSLQDAFKEAKKLAGFDPEKLYPILHYEGNEMNLSRCFGSTAKMARCLKRGGAHVGQPLDQAEDVAGHLAAWVETAERHEALALWPGYLGLSWR